MVGFDLNIFGEGLVAGGHNLQGVATFLFGLKVQVTGTLVAVTVVAVLLIDQINFAIDSDWGQVDAHRKSLAGDFGRGGARDWA